MRVFMAVIYCSISRQNRCDTLGAEFVAAFIGPPPDQIAINALFVGEDREPACAGRWEVWRRSFARICRLEWQSIALREREAQTARPSGARILNSVISVREPTPGMPLGLDMGLIVANYKEILFMMQ
jgi:hypothetical protein